MNNVLTRNIILFVVLVLLQVGVLNQVQLGGFINPYLYILFIILLPSANDKTSVSQPGVPMGSRMMNRM